MSAIDVIETVRKMRAQETATKSRISANASMISEKTASPVV